MKPHFYRYLAALALGCSLLSCGDKDHLSESKMASLMADLQLAESYSSSDYKYASDSARNVLRLSVLKQHGVTQEEYDRSLQWYGHNLDKYSKLCEAIDKQLQKREKKFMAAGAEGTAESSGESDVSIWPYSRMAMISPLSPQDAIQFSLPINDMEKGQRLEWTLRLSRMVQAQMVLGVDYKEGGTSYLQSRSMDDKHVTVKLQTDSSRTVTRVYGMMRVLSHSDLPVWADSIALRKLPFAKEDYYRYNSQSDYRGPRKNEPHKPKPTVKPITDKPVSDRQVIPSEAPSSSVPAPGSNAARGESGLQNMKR